MWMPSSCQCKVYTECTVHSKCNSMNRSSNSFCLRLKSYRNCEQPISRFKQLRLFIFVKARVPSSVRRRFPNILEVDTSYGYWAAEYMENDWDLLEHNALFWTSEKVRTVYTVTKTGLRALLLVSESIALKRKRVIWTTKWNETYNTFWHNDNVSSFHEVF